jgi:hypothetical protein
MNAANSLQGRGFRFVRRTAGGLLCLGFVASLVLAQPKADDKAVDPDHAAKMVKGLEIFKKHVKPLLVQSCLKCHGGREDVDGEFDLADRAGLLKGGPAGPAVIVGKGKDSLLYKLVTHQREPHMPHNRAKLPAEAIAHIVSWIDNGAPYDDPLVAGKNKDAWTKKQIADDARQFWSFQPLKRVNPPAVGGAWVKNPVDHFIFAKLQAAGLAPNPTASKRQLIRRAYFDLVGLPPPADEVEAFVKDPAPDAYDKLLDRLLASKHHGERWARHWLDLARFAESHGFEHDYDRPTAFHYRDFVIEALNADLPYDTFVKWQIAGDEYAPDNQLALKATGFLAAGVHSTQITKNEVEKHRYDELDDMVATLTTTMLGLTVGCARCHDHKFDPIPQRDYYRLAATFTTTIRSEVEVKPLPEEFAKIRAAFDQEHAGFVETLKKFEEDQLPVRLIEWEKSPAAQQAKPPQNVAIILKLPADQRNKEQSAEVAKWYRTIDTEWKKLNQKVQDHAKKAPQPPKMMISSEGLPAVRLHTQGADFLNETHFLRRGDVNQKDGLAAPGFLQVLLPGAEADNRWQASPPAGWRTSYRRRALAEWITDTENGGGRLLARVIVNRLWQHHLGRGIVATPSDFGNRGEAPTHPELLDWLATELIKNGWRLKPMHKLIMSSAVYQQTSQFDEAKAKLDRDNKWCWRRPVRRLEGETIRDSMLTVGGVLETRMYGPGTLDESSKRRSIYFTVKRSKLQPMMQVFDAPDGLTSIGDRPTTTIAPQALLLLNNPQVRTYARGFARRIAPDEKTTVETAVPAGYLMALGRPPTADELADSSAFVKAQLESYQKANKADGRELAFADFCQVLMCLNEFVYVD